MCECILGLRSDPSNFWATVTLASYLVSRIGIKSGVYFLFLDRNPKFGVWMHLFMVISHVPFWGHGDDIWPSFLKLSCQEHISE